MVDVLNTINNVISAKHWRMSNDDLMNFGFVRRPRPPQEEPPLSTSHAEERHALRGPTAYDRVYHTRQPVGEQQEEPQAAPHRPLRQPRTDSNLLTLIDQDTPMEELRRRATAVETAQRLMQQHYTSSANFTATTSTATTIGGTYNVR